MGAWGVEYDQSDEALDNLYEMGEHLVFRLGNYRQDHERGKMDFTALRALWITTKRMLDVDPDAFLAGSEPLREILGQVTAYIEDKLDTEKLQWEQPDMYAASVSREIREVRMWLEEWTID